VKFAPCANLTSSYILREALEYVDERKALINAHYEELHRSATRAYEPFIDVLSGE
jgi:hypothetical protein